MRDLGAKMAELKFEAPLAKFEDGDDFSTTQNTLNTLNLNLKDANSEQDNKIRILEEVVCGAHLSKDGIDGKLLVATSPNCNTVQAAVDSFAQDNISNGMFRANELNDNDTIDKKNINANNETVDNFTEETFGGSLEDLVNTFDERITKCFGNYGENIEELAPVQIRSQEEIINECQMWWTITGNFGNILPIDWSKSFTRKMQLASLHLDENNMKEEANHYDDFLSEDEAVANDLDMHKLILNGLNADNDVTIKSADEVIKEIDDIMDEAESPSNDFNNISCHSEVIEKTKEVLGAPLFAEKLQNLSHLQLNELYMEMEVLIQELSETLINELALRDELEFEKELKNSFISLLLSVQNKRRQYHVEKKRGKFQGPEPKYLTTVIPYHVENSTPNNQSLQVLIKVLKAINEDSPTVPTLLTDYILKVLCPT